MQDNLYNLAFERSILSSIVFEPQQFDELSSALRKGNSTAQFKQNFPYAHPSIRFSSSKP